MNRARWELSMVAEAGLRGIGILRSLVLAGAVLLGLSACTSQPRATTSQSSGHAAVTRSQVVADIDAAVATLTDIHPNLYWRADPRDIVRLKQELATQVPERPSALDVHSTFLRLTAAFNDAHVSTTDFPARLTGSDGKSLFEIYREAGVFPAAFDPGTDSLRVAAVSAGEQALVPGDVIIAINGIAAHDLLTGIEGIISGSAETKHFAARQEFGVMLWTQGVKAPFHVELGPRGSNGPRIETLQTVPPAEPAQVSGENWRDPIEYRLLEDRIGLITFHEMTESPERFTQRLVRIFDAVASDHPAGIVVDIRRNNGGNSELGDLLLAFMNDTPYRPFAERRWKVSRTCQNWYDERDADERRYFDGYLAAPVGQDLVSTQLPTRRSRSVARTYSGPVAALIGPGTISSAAILADSIKTFHLAMLFGQPITEPANMYGEVCEATLPQTGIRIGAPSALFIRADGDAASKDPVVPDILVGSDVAGFSTDPVLDAARRWLHSRPGAS